MQTVWSRIAPSRCGCSSSTPSSLSVARRAAPPRRSLRLLTPTSTFCYTTIFAGAVLADKNKKDARRQQWDEAIAKAKQELEDLDTGTAGLEQHQSQPEGEDGRVQAWGAGISEHWRLAQNVWEEVARARLSGEEMGQEVVNNGLLDWDDPFVQELLVRLAQEEDAAGNYAAYWDLLAVDPMSLRDGSSPPWPPNTGLSLRRNRLPPQSLWAPSNYRERAYGRQVSRKKLHTHEASVVLMVYKWLAHLKLWENPGEVNLQDLPESLKRLASLSQHEVVPKMRKLRQLVHTAQCLPYDDGWDESIRDCTEVKRMASVMDIVQDVQTVQQAAQSPSASEVAAYSKEFTDSLKSFASLALEVFQEFRVFRQTPSVLLQEARRLKQVEFTRFEQALAELSIRPYYSQYDIHEFHAQDRQRNDTIRSLFRDHKADPSKLPFSELVLRLANCLLTSSAQPSIHTYNLLITGFGSLQRNAFCESAIVSFLDTKSRPNEVTCASILTYYLRSRQADRFSWFVKMMRGLDEKGLTLAHPMVKITTAAQGRLIRRELGGKVLQAVPASPLVLNTILRGTLHFAGFTRAWRVYEDFLADGWGADINGLRPLLVDCLNRADRQGGKAVWLEMLAIRHKHEGVRFGRGVITTMLAFCLRCGDRDLHRRVRDLARQEGYRGPLLWNGIDVSSEAGLVSVQEAAAAQEENVAAPADLASMLDGVVLDAEVTTSEDAATQDTVRMELDDDIAVASEPCLPLDLNDPLSIPSPPPPPPPPPGPRTGTDNQSTPHRSRRPSTSSSSSPHSHHHPLGASSSVLTSPPFKALRETRPLFQIRRIQSTKPPSNGPPVRKIWHDYDDVDAGHDDA